jgi:hypothetical protein
MASDRLDPATYYEFYRHGGRVFLPESLTERFRWHVAFSLREQRIRWAEAMKKSAGWASGQDPWEEYKDFCSAEAQYNAVDEIELLADELSILSLHRYVEIERGRILAKHFSFVDAARLSSDQYLNKAFPFLRDLYGAAAIRELRLIANCIKHSGRVSSSLARCNPCWREGDPFPALGPTYQRLAPFVHAYWVDLVQTAADRGNQGRPLATEGAIPPEEVPRTYDPDAEALHQLRELLGIREM